MAERGFWVTGAALWLLLFVLTACSIDPGVDYITLPTSTPEDSPPPSDSPYKEVSYLVQLIDALEDETTDNIRIADNITLSGISKIPIKKNLEIMKQKTLTINEEITISGAISIMDDGNMQVQSDSRVTFDPGSRFSIAPRGSVITGSQSAITARGTVAVQGQIALGNRARLIVDQNMDVEGGITVGNGAELIIGKDVKGRINGTITVLNGGQIRDQTPEGSWARNKDGVGAIILKHGSLAYINLDSSTKSDAPLIGPLANAGLLMLSSTVSELTLMNNGYLLEGDARLISDFTLKRGEVLMIRNGVLKTSPGKDFILEEGANFVIENQAVFEFVDKNINGRLNGTIEVKKGGTFLDREPMGRSLFSQGGTGSLIVHAGAVVAHIEDNNIDNSVDVGTNGGGDTEGQVIQLEAGAIEIKNNKYFLDGSAILVRNQEFNTLTLSPLSVLRVSENVELRTSDAARSITGQFSGDNAAQIVLVSSTSKIVNIGPPPIDVFLGPKLLSAGFISGWK